MIQHGRTVDMFLTAVGSEVSQLETNVLPTGQVVRITTSRTKKEREQIHIIIIVDGNRSARFGFNVKGQEPIDELPCVKIGGNIAIGWKFSTTDPIKGTVSYHKNPVRKIVLLNMSSE